MDDIILIGPVRTGKSTLGGLLAGELGLPHISLDDLRWKYYKEIGFDENLAKQIRETGGFLALVYYWNLFSAHSVERMLSEHQGCVFDFGAGIYESNEMYVRVENTLSRYSNVVLILPSPDLEESLQILKERNHNPPKDLAFDINRHFIYHHTYHDLAKINIYTKGHTPEESCQEILELVDIK